jgi:hypothetical protein
MTMLRDEVETAIHDLIVACRKAEESLSSTARQTADAELSDVLAKAGRRMGDCAAALADDSRSLGDLPGTPDQDSLSLKSAVTSIVAALSPDERATLFEDATGVHEAVMDAADRARGLDLPERARQDVEHCREQASRTLAHLRELRERIHPE